MNTYTITSKQISDLHNGKCALHRLQEMIQDNFKDDAPITKSINEAMRLMAPVITSLMDDKDRAYDAISDEMDVVREKLELRTIWSIYERTEFPQKWAGRMMTYQGLGCKIPADTKIDRGVLYVVANELIVDSGDDHHIFIEDFIENADGTISLVTGS